MEIIDKFGFNPVLLGAQVLNFLIIFFILKKFMYKPLLEVLRKRQKIIKEGLKDAEDARIKLEKVSIEERSILQQAQLQSKKMIEDAKLESEEVFRRMHEDAKKQTEKLVADTREQMIKESEDTQKKLALNTSKIAVSILESALKNFFSAREQKQVLASVVKKIKTK